MHEYSIVSHLLELCTEHLESNNAKCATKILISIGQRANIEPELLRSAFEILKLEYAGFEKSKIDIITQKLMLECKGCAKSFHSLDNPTCPFCESRDTFITQGRDVMLESVELEI